MFQVVLFFLSYKAGGGAVEVTISGKKEVTKVKLSPEVVDPDDIEMLEDLIVQSNLLTFQYHLDLLPLVIISLLLLPFYRKLLPQLLRLLLCKKERREQLGTILSNLIGKEIQVDIKLIHKEEDNIYCFLYLFWYCLLQFPWF